MVIGAGPIGSYLAYRLAKEGHRVAVIERNSTVGGAVCCTGIVGRECFQRYPISDTDVWFEGKSCKVFSPAGKLIRLEKDNVQAYVIDRPGLDNGLAEKAQNEGADYLLSTRVEGVYRVDHRVRADVECNGRIFNVDSKVVAVSNGFGLTLPRKLGLGQVGDYVLGAQVEVEAGELDEVEVYFGKNVAPGFFAWLVPTRNGNALVGLLSRRKPGLYMKQLLVRLAEQGKIRGSEARISYGGIPLRPLPRTYADRMVVVGDAAGQVKPTTGGGIYYGLLSADIAAATIDRGLNEDDLSSRVLKRYESGWKKIMGRDLQTGYWARRMYEGLSDDRVDHVFDIINDNGIQDVLLQSSDFSFDWHGTSVLRMAKHKALRRHVWAAARSLLPF